MYKEVIEKKFKDEEKITALNLYKKMIQNYQKMQKKIFSL